MIIGIITLIVLGCIAFLNHPLFGRHPRGQRRERINRSPNFKNGEAQNLIPTPQLTDGYTMSKVMLEFLFGKKSNTKPHGNIPVTPVDWQNIDLSKDGFYWFGHSSYLLIVSGNKILIDPVFTTNGAPIIKSNVAFQGTTFITIEELPLIDYLVITHDHFDHLDYTTIRKIRSKVGHVICGLGVGSHFDRWGYAPENITELDWWETAHLENGMSLTATPVRHFSGRTFFHKNNTLFCSYVLQSESKRIFIGGDSGFGPHFEEIGKRFAPFDLIFLENGQYNTAWHYIHLHPSESAEVIRLLQPKVVMPVHHSKFALSNHDWKAPLQAIIQHRSEQIEILTPMIGQFVAFDNTSSFQVNWWVNVQ